MGSRYLVTMIPGHIEMHWGSVLMCATYMAMFWGITLWLAECVGSASVEAALGPKWNTKAFGILAVYVMRVWDQLARDCP